MNNGEGIKYNFLQINDSQYAIYTIAFCPDPNNSLFATAGQDSVIRIYDPKHNNKLINEITDNKSKVLSIAFSCNYLASGGMDEVLRIYSLNDNFQLITEIKDIFCPILSVQFCNGDMYLACGCDDEILRIYDVK